MNAASKGEKALADSNAPLAIEQYTRALIELPRAPNYYIQRSTAYSRLKPADGGPSYRAALRDAEIALALAAERGKRELILSAQFRRGVSLFQLARYVDAAFVFMLIDKKIARPKADDDKATRAQNAMAERGSKAGYENQLPIWMAKVQRKLDELAEGDEKAVVSVVEFPKDTRIPSEKDLKAELVGKAETALPETGQSSKSTASERPKSAATGEQKPAASVSASAAPEKFRHEWYQSQNSVVVTLYAKGVPKDKVGVELKDDSASLQFPLPSGSGYDFTLDPLYAPINPSTSKVSVMGTKIEIVLQKQTPGQKWQTLEGSGETVTLADRPAVPATSSTAGPAYPTSSRHGAKDWDKLASSLTAKKAKDKKDGSKDDGNESDGAESVDSELGGDAVDGFFKKLYAGADPDTRRAMVKSYVESQGTSLSTNWSEVGTKTMDAHPPS